MSDTPFENGHVSVTIKHNGKFEDPWIVFHGSPAKIKDQLIETFALGEGDVPFAERSLSDVMYEANKQALAEYNATSQLNGTVIKTNKSSRNAKPAVSTESVSDGTGIEPEGPSEDQLILQSIAKVDSVADLQKLWAENQTAFAAGSLMEAYKARGKELSAK